MTVLLDGDNIRHGLNKNLGFRWGKRASQQLLSARASIPPHQLHAPSSLSAKTVDVSCLASCMYVRVCMCTPAYVLVCCLLCPSPAQRR